MRPLKSVSPIAIWTLRIVVVLWILQLYLKPFMNFNLQSIHFFISAILLIFGVLLFIGGFLSKPTLTVLSGLIISIVSLYKTIVAFDGTLGSSVVIYLTMTVIGFYFLTKGNNR